MPGAKLLLGAPPAKIDPPEFPPEGERVTQGGVGKLTIPSLIQPTGLKSDRPGSGTGTESGTDERGRTANGEPALCTTACVGPETL